MTEELQETKMEIRGFGPLEKCFDGVWDLATSLCRLLEAIELVSGDEDRVRELCQQRFEIKCGDYSLRSEE